MKRNAGKAPVVKGFKRRVTEAKYNNAPKVLNDTFFSSVDVPTPQALPPEFLKDPMRALLNFPPISLNSQDSQQATRPSLRKGTHTAHPPLFKFTSC